MTAKVGGISVVRLRAGLLIPVCGQQLAASPVGPLTIGILKCDALQQVAHRGCFVMRFDVRPMKTGVRLQGKVWKRGMLEPRKWLCEYIDRDAPSTRPDSGRAGLYSNYLGVGFDNLRVEKLPEIKK